MNDEAEQSRREEVGSRRFIVSKKLIPTCRPGGD